MTTPATNPNLGASGELFALYDATGHQTNVLAQAGPVTQDASSGLYSAPTLTQDKIINLILNGQGFIATSGLLSTLTNANVYIALGLLCSAIAKNVLIYRVTAMVQNVTGDIRLNSMTSFDANIATAVTAANQSVGSATTALATTKSTANSNTAPTATTGTTRNQVAGTANGVIELLQQGSGIYIPAGATQGVTCWIKIPTAANTGAINFEWVEF